MASKRKPDYSVSSNPAITAYNQQQAANIARGASPTAGLQFPSASINTPTISPVQNMSAPFNVNGLTAQPLNLAPVPVPTAAAGGMEYVSAASQGLQALIAEQQKRAQQLSDQTMQSQKNVGDLYSKLLGQGERNEQIYKENGVDELQNKVNTYTSQIEAEALSARRQIEKIQKNNPGGVFGGALQDQVNSIERESLSRQADLAILQTAATRNYEAAASIADRKIAAETEQLKTAVEASKYFYENNKQDLTKAEDKAFQLRVGELERQLQEETQNKKISQTAIIEASQYGAPESLIRQAQALYNNGGSPQQIASMLGAYSANALNAQTERLNQQNIRSQISTRSQELAMSREKFEYEKEAAAADIANGVLTDAEIKNVDNSPQGKKVTSLAALKQKITNYKALIDRYGTASVGAAKTTLDTAKADLDIAYKTAAELGALQGPDILLLEKALKPATFANPLTQGWAKLTGQGVGAIQAGLTEATNVLNKQAATNITQLFARNPKYKSSDYVNSLVLPLLGDIDTLAQQNDFDIQSARDAGWNDYEIFAELAK